MITRKLVYREDSEHGISGWFLKDAPSSFNASNGRMIAHDILEHFADTTEHVHDECQALGAYILTRLDTEYYYEKFSIYQPYEALASELASLLRGIMEDYAHLKEPPRTYRISTKHGDHEETLIKASQKALILWREECDEEYQDPNIAKRYLNQMIAWMRIGYRRALRRYAEVPLFRISETFDLITKRIDQIDTYDLIEGQEMILSVSPKTAEVSARLIDYYED